MPFTFVEAAVRAAEKFDRRPDRPEDTVAAIPVPDGRMTFAPEEVADPSSNLQTKYRTDTWISSDVVLNLEEAR